MTKLENEIKKHDKLYWEEQNPQISDQDYDKLIEKLKKEDPENPLLSKIHTSITKNGKVRHKIPMLSLNKVYGFNDLIKWCTKVARDGEELFTIETKYDGCSANYENNILATRGDGFVGEAITDKLPIINTPKNKKVRGEIVFLKSTFEKYKHVLLKRDGSEYSNPRNACAGLLNRDDIDIDNKILNLIPFDNTQLTLTLKELKDNFDFDELVKATQNSDIPADGLVVKITDTGYRKSLGITTHHPKGEMAFKFKNETAETTLINVTWSVGKETITPVGNIEPTELNGVVIKNVSLHNPEFILKKGIAIGNKLLIERAGDVIPHVLHVIPSNNKITELICKFCPECGTETKYIEPELYCSNPDCIGKVVSKIYDSILKLGIERIGKPTIRNMVKILDISHVVGVFKLNKGDLLKLPKFGDKKASNTLYEIQKVKDDGVYEWQILAAVNIPGIGETVSKLVCSRIGLYNLCNMYEHPNFATILCEFDGIEEKRANDIIVGVQNNIELISELWDMLPLKTYAMTEDIKLPTICFTGTFPEKKSIYYAKLEGKYAIVNSVTKKLDILVVADPTKNSTKQKKAEKMGINIMSIDEIMKGD